MMAVLTGGTIALFLMMRTKMVPSRGEPACLLVLYGVLEVRLALGLIDADGGARWIEVTDLDGTGVFKTWRPVPR